MRNTRHGEAASSPAGSVHATPAGSVPAAMLLWCAMPKGNPKKDIPQVHLWCSVQTARCADMPTAMQALSSATGSSCVTRKSLQLLCHVQRGSRKRQVFLAPRMPNAQRNHLFPGQGTEKEASLAPLQVEHSGWESAHPLFLPNYVSSPSSLYETHTSRDAYGGVEEAAG